MSKRAKLPLTLSPGCVLTVGKAEVLRQLAGWGEGGATAGPTMAGGTLAMLVQFGLAERLPPPANDALGCRRYRINDAGRAVLQRVGLAG